MKTLIVDFGGDIYHVPEHTLNGVKRVLGNLACPADQDGEGELVDVWITTFDGSTFYIPQEDEKVLTDYLKTISV